MIRRYLVPVVATLVTLIVYTWLISPWVGGLRDDFMFLRQARISELQRQLQAAQQLQQQRQAPPVQPSHKE